MGTTPQYLTDAAAAAQGALLKLQPHGATPPVSTYLTQSTLLEVRVFNAIPNLVVQISALILLPDGRISLNSWNFTPFSTRGVRAFVQALTEGFLLELTVNTNTAPPVNRCFAQVDLIFGSSGPIENTQVLCQGYLNQGSFLSFPNGSLASMTDGAGAVVDVTGTTPGAGAEISETVPTNALWVLKTFTYSLTTSAAAANRTPILIVDDGANILLESPALSVLAAGSTNRYVTGDNAAGSVVNNGVQWQQLVTGLRLLPGYRMRTSTVNLQAGDQYTAPQYTVQEWLFT